MSNIAYIHTPKFVKSYDIKALLEKINRKRFGGKMEIGRGGESGKEDDSVLAWRISYPGSWDCLWIHQDTPKKLACKHPHNQWMEYVFMVFQEELAAMVKGKLSDEGVQGTWKPKPKKYPSYLAWVNMIHSHSHKVLDPRAYYELIELEMSFAPKGMEDY